MNPKRIIYSDEEFRHAFYLSGVKWNEDGSLKSGYVENGDWEFEIRDGEVLAKNGNSIVNRWKLEHNYKIFPVPSHVRGNYNEVIHAIMVLEGK